MLALLYPLLNLSVFSQRRYDRILANTPALFLGLFYALGYLLQLPRPLPNLNDILLSHLVSAIPIQQRALTSRRLNSSESGIKKVISSMLS